MSLKRFLMWVFLYAAAFAVTPALAQLDPERMLKAVEIGDIPFVREMLDRGADPDTADPNGNTLLAAASADGNLEMARFLIARKARINNRNAFGDSPLMVAAYHGRIEMVRFLIANGADVNPPGWTPLHYCAWQGHTDICTVLIDLRAWINVQAPNGATPLMMAVLQGKTNSVRLLLAHRASTDFKSPSGDTALSWAIRDNRREIVALLKQAGAKE